MDSIKSADQCVGGEMISWVSYPYNDSGRTCFVYPRYLVQSGEWFEVSDEAFPNNGSFAGTLAGSTQLTDVRESLGHFVVAKVNTDSFQENIYYKPEDPKNALYRILYNPALPKGVSDLELERFSSHALSTDLVQIVDIVNSPSFIKPFSAPVTVREDVDDLICRYILVRNASGTCFGPFEYSVKEENAIELIAASDKDYRIARFSGIDDDLLLRIRGSISSEEIDFVLRKKIDKLFDEIPADEKLDWLPHKELLNIITRAINTSKAFSSMSKTELRGIKSAIWEYNDNSGQIELDFPRKQKIVNWLSDMENWNDLPQAVSEGIVDSFDDKQLVDLVLDDRFYPLFKDRLIDSSGIQTQIEDEKQKLEMKLSEVKQELGEAKERLDKALCEEEEANRKASEAKEHLERIRDEALDQKREERDALIREIEEKETELKTLNEEYERAIDNKSKIERDVENIIGGINDEIATSTKILESEILKKVVSAVYGLDLRDEESVSLSQWVGLREGGDSLTDDQAVDIIFKGITQRAGRQVTRNDVINLMICLSQGYITTFAGLPGTGKTSLCNALAGVLGLLGSEERSRFTEINVENGWTSYKDYVGYFNPLSKSYEKSNTKVYDAMRRLSLECSENIAPSEVPPYVFLLDEANLSPIEHYWSPFLRACDTFQEEGTPFSLGGKRVWKLPNYVRFLATVNFDHTTEALSNRFLDRSWVITLNPDFLDLELDQVNYRKEFSNELAFSSEKLYQVFGLRESDSPDLENIQLLDDLARICKQYSFPISPRSMVMMRKYIATASRLMSLKTRDSKFAPVDYAFSQKVLPQLSGPAEYVKELIDELLAKCTELKVTRTQLEHMKEVGKESGFYQYFG